MKCPCFLINSHILYLIFYVDFLERAVKTLKKFDRSTESSKIIRTLQLLGRFFSQSEKNGTGNLTYHSALIKGELLTILINNEVCQTPSMPKKLEVKAFSNKTIFYLKHQVAIQAKTSWDGVKLFRYGPGYVPYEIGDSENGRTLNEIRLRNGETILAQKKPTPYIPQVCFFAY
jgi:hypothetical protein